MNTSEHLTPADAAKLAGVSRATIVRALQGGHLLGRRDNSGRWHIDPAELSAWRERRAAATVHRPTVNTDHRRELEHLRAEVARLRDAERDHTAELARLTAEASAAATRLADATAERDAWRAQAAALATRQEPPTDERRRSFTLFRLFRRDR